MNEAPPRVNVELFACPRPDLDGWLTIQAEMKPATEEDEELLPEVVILRTGGSYREKDEAKGFREVEKLVRRQAAAQGLEVATVRRL